MYRGLTEDVQYIRPAGRGSHTGTNLESLLLTQPQNYFAVSEREDLALLELGLLS